MSICINFISQSWLKENFLQGNMQPYKTVEAQALEDSLVMKFPVEAVQVSNQQTCLYQ